MRNRLDYLFLLPSYNRYDYLIQVIDRIVEQTKTLNIKIGIVDDNSNDKRYDGLQKKYGDILLYEKNEVNYGKDKYYLTVNKLLNIAKNNKSEKYIFLADDSLPSKKFLVYVEKYLQKGAKVVNTAIHQKELRTNWGLNNWVDGGLVITHDIFSKVNQNLKNVVRVGYGTGVFREITLRLNMLNIRVHFPKQSLLYHMGHTDSVMHKEIRKIEQIHSYTFIDEVETPDVFRSETYDLLNQKVQISVSNAVRNFKTKMISKYDLDEYVSKTQPTVFFGMYDENDYKKFINHVGQKIIVWCGTDALNVKKNKHWWNELKKGVNISMSQFISKSLEFCNINSCIIPVTPTKTIINVKPKGDNIYWYYNSESKRDFYGGKIVNQIKKMTNYNIIETNINTFNEEEIQKVYESCFLGLRLTEHDGLPNTVVEMGLMGRYCLHNGNTPNSIHYDPNNIEDIVKKINKEYILKNQIDDEIAKKVFNYMSFGDNIKKIFFSYDTVVNNNKFDIIHKNEILRKKQFPKNFEQLSIIIPTFNNVEYIDDCINSIVESSKNFSVELLIGIDGCEKTFNYIKTKKYSSNISFFYFHQNEGPYLIKNTLVGISNSDKLLFFDSDDVMNSNMVETIIKELDRHICVKPKFEEFGGKSLGGTKFGEGVFGIKKDLFLKMNGFEPWMVAADSDFMGRLYKTKSKILHTQQVLFKRRVHLESLTNRKDTGMSSSLRGNYAKISKNKKGDGNPSILHTRPFEFITTETFIEVKEHNQQLEIRNQKINSVLNKKDRKVVEAQPQKKQDPVVLDRLDFLYKNKSEEPRVIKTNKPNNRQELIDKKNGTTKNTIKEMFNIKPNHREGKNFINLGGKFKT